MRPRRKNFLSLMILLSIGFFLWAGEKEHREKRSEKKSSPSLIRKELLWKERRDLVPSPRNIFSPQNSGNRTGSPSDRFQHDSQRISASSKEEASYGNGDIIRYIGYVVSGNKIVALVVFRGHMLSVEEGEVIDAEVKVARITREEIEISWASSGKRKYALEGEGE